MTFTERDLRDTLGADAGPEPVATDDGWSEVVKRRAEGGRSRDRLELRPQAPRRRSRRSNRHARTSPWRAAPSS